MVLALLQDNLSTLLSLPYSHKMKRFLFSLNTTRVAEVSVLTTMKLIILSLALLGPGFPLDRRYSIDSRPLDIDEPLLRQHTKSQSVMHRL